MAGDRVLYRGKSAVPGYELLGDHFREWVPQLLEIRETEKSLAELRAAEKEIHGMTATRTEYAEALQVSWAAYRRRHVERIAKFLSETVKAKDPLARGERLDFLTRAFIPWEFFEEAMDLLPDEVFSEVPTEAKQKEISKIQKQKQKLEMRITELRCPPYLQLVGGELRDVREVFIAAWREKQREASEGVDPQGFDLRGAGDDLRWAYVQLGIASSVNEKGLSPAARD